MRCRTSFKYSLFLILLVLFSQLFTLNVFAIDFGKVTSFSNVVSPSLQRQLVLPNNSFINTFGTGARILFEVIANQWVMMLLTLILVTILFYAIFSLGLMNIPIFKDGDAEKKRHMRMISITLALLSSIGLLGYAGFDGRSFSVGNVLTRSSTLLGTFGTVGVWFFSLILGAIVYFSGKKAKAGLEPGPHPAVSGWALTFIATGASLWLGFSLLGSPWTFLGAMLFIGGVVGLLWPKKTNSTSVSSSNSDNSSSSSENPSESFNNVAEASNDAKKKENYTTPRQVRKIVNDDKEKKQVFQAIKDASYRNFFIWRWCDDVIKIIDKVSGEVDKILTHPEINTDKASRAITNRKKEIINIVNNFKFSRFMKRDLRKEHSFMETIKRVLKSRLEKLNELNVPEGTELFDIIEKEKRIISSTERYFTEIGNMLIVMQKTLRDEVTEDNNIFVGSANKLKDIRIPKNMVDPLKTLQQFAHQLREKILNLLNQAKFIHGMEAELEQGIKQIYKFNDQLSEHSEGLFEKTLEEMSNRIANELSLMTGKTPSPDKVETIKNSIDTFEESIKQMSRSKYDVSAYVDLPDKYRYELRNTQSSDIESKFNKAFEEFNNATSSMSNPAAFYGVERYAMERELKKMSGLVGMLQDHHSKDDFNAKHKQASSFYWKYFFEVSQEEIKKQFGILEHCFIEISNRSTEIDGLNRKMEKRRIAKLEKEIKGLQDIIAKSKSEAFAHLRNLENILTKIYEFSNPRDGDEYRKKLDYINVIADRFK